MTNNVPRHAIRVSAKDILRCQVWSKGASYDLYVRYLIMLDDGTIVPAVQFLNQGGSYVKATGNYPLTDGWLIAVSLRSSVSGYAGFSYATAEIVRQEDGTNYGQIVVCQGMVSQVRSVSWPGYNPEGSLDVAESIDSLNGAGTSGNDLTITIASNTIVELSVLRITWATSSTVATRRMVLIIDNGTNIIWRKASIATQIASQSRTYQYAFGQKDELTVAGGTFDHIPLPRLSLRGDYRIRTAVENLQANDGAMTWYYALKRQIET